MNFEFTQGRLVGFHAGQTRSEIENLFGEKPYQFMKTSFSVSPTDVYNNRSIHVHFDKDDVIEGIEISRPNVFLCFGRNVLGEIAREIADWIRLEDSSFAEDALGYFIVNGRLGLYVPEKGDHPDVLIKTVYVSYEVPAIAPPSDGRSVSRQR
ncbi:hypothetical protein [Luteibacter yeojuensis]